MASGSGSTVVTEGGLRQATRMRKAQARLAVGTALTSAEPDSVLLKAVAALVQESPVEA